MLQKASKVTVIGIVGIRKKMFGKAIKTKMAVKVKPVMTRFL